MLAEEARVDHLCPQSIDPSHADEGPAAKRPAVALGRGGDGCSVLAWPSSLVSSVLNHRATNRGGTVVCELVIIPAFF